MKVSASSPEKLTQRKCLHRKCHDKEVVTHLGTEKRPLNPEDILSFTCVGDPQLSPDGSRLAYVRQTFDQDTHESKTDIFVIDLTRGTKTQLTNSGKDRSPRWSPAGDRIAFVSSRSGRSQIWIIDVSGGEAWHLPTKEEVQGSPVWGPGGTRIFFNASAFSKPDEWVPYPGSPEGDRQRAEEYARRMLESKDKNAQGKNRDEKKKNEVKVITRLRYRFDGVGYFGDLRRQVFYVEVPDTPPGTTEPDAVQLTVGDFDHSPPSPSPDGKWIAVEAFRSGDADYVTRSQVWVFNVETRQPHLLYDAPGPVYNLQWSPDGRMIAFYGHDSARGVSTKTDLYVACLDGRPESLSSEGKPAPLGRENIHNLTQGTGLHAGMMVGSDIGFRGGSTLYWDGGKLYFCASERGAAYLYSTTPAQGRWDVQRLLGSADVAISAFSVSGGTVVVRQSTLLQPENLFLVETGDSHQGTALEQLTFENHELMEQVELGAWEKFSYKSPDGQELDGWLIYPAGFEPSQVKAEPGKYSFPLVVPVHGGPHSAYGSAFMFHGQMFAGRGYAVAYFNPRGSASYGQDFMDCIDGKWGDKDYLDVMSGVEAVVSKGFIDESNMFIHGWSYGGYMTTWVVTQTGLFKAACAGAPVTDMYAGYGTSDILWADEREFGAKPWEDPQTLLKSSPLNFVANVSTPILLMHGENDLRCPVLHTEEFYTGLKRLGKTAVMIRYPGEFHGLSKPVHRIDRHQRLLAWFEYYRSQ